MPDAGKQIASQILYERQQQGIKNNRAMVAPIIIATDMRTPDNIASVLRLADAAFSNRVIFVTDELYKIELDNKIQRLSRNTDRNILIEQYELAAFLTLCKSLPDMIALEITSHSTNLFETELPDTCCLVVGGESHGVKQRILDSCQSAVHIPMYGHNGSMNVTHALAICLFEWRRQKHQ